MPGYFKFDAMTENFPESLPIFAALSIPRNRRRSRSCEQVHDRHGKLFMIAMGFLGPLLTPLRSNALQNQSFGFYGQMIAPLETTPNLKTRFIDAPSAHA
jgi:hypothetical protein